MTRAHAEPSTELDLGPTSKHWVPALTSLEVYQAAVKRLTAQIKDHDKQLNDLRRLHAQEVRILRAQLREGTTLEMLALRKSVSQWRTRAQAAEARLREARRSV